MRHARRMTALLVSLLLAHVTWVGSGFACRMPGMGNISDGMASMAGMDMSSTEMDGMGMAGTLEQPSGAPAHDHEGCQLPWAPDGCQSMAPCAPLAMASLLQVLQVPGDVPAAVASQLVLTPPSQVRAPELPPPRA